MQINSAAQYILSNSAHPSTEKCHEQDNKKIANDAVQAKAIDTVEITGTDDSKASGVLKNLQDGHYKGVADVRLRINFADRIAVLESEQAKQIATDGTTNVVQGVTDQINTLLESDNLTDGQAAAISGAVAAFESGTTASINNLADKATSPATTIDDIRSYFVVLTEAITAATAESSESTDEISASTVDMKNITATNAAEATIFDSTNSNTLSTDQAPDSTSDSPDFSIDSFMANLIASFESSMQQLSSTLDSNSVLPGISEPSGQGKAFDKFMAIYNEMNQPAIEPPTESTINVLL